MDALAVTNSPDFEVVYMAMSAIEASTNQASIRYVALKYSHEELP